MANFNSGDFRLSSELSPDLAIEDQRINRRQKIADLLIGQGLEPINNPQHGRFYVAPHPLQGLGKMAQAAAGAYMTYANDRDAKGLIEKNKTNITDALMKYRAATAPIPAIQGAPGNATDLNAATRQPFNETAANVTQMGSPPPQLNVGEGTSLAPQETPSTIIPKAGAPEQPNPGARDAIREALVSQIPQVRQMAALDYQSQEAEKRTKEAQDFQAKEHALTRESNRQTQLASLAQHKATLEAQLADRALGRQENADLKRELEQKHSEVVAKIAELNVAGRKDVANIKAAGSQKLPSPALKLQDDHLEAIGTASSIDADLGAFEKQINEGKLNPGLINNLVAGGRNMVNMSTPESRNLASFQASMEKMRNDSLRLNKGVQTEGDAVRAWNEHLSNINDKGVVLQRLGEIRRINQRAVTLRRNEIDVLRGNYGMGPLDTSKFSNQSPAVGGVPKFTPDNADAEFEKLPSGAHYIGPDGVERVKP